MQVFIDQMYSLHCYTYHWGLAMVFDAQLNFGVSVQLPFSGFTVRRFRY